MQAWYFADNTSQVSQVQTGMLVSLLLVLARAQSIPDHYSQTANELSFVVSWPFDKNDFFNAFIDAIRGTSYY